MGVQRCELLTPRSLRTERCESANVRMREGGGRADGLHRPIERFRFERFSGSISASRMMHPTED